MKRNKIVRMDVQAVAKMVIGHYALPADARFKGVELDSKNGKLAFELEHQTFEMVKNPPLVDGDGSEGKEKVDKAVKKASKVSKKG